MEMQRARITVPALMEERKERMQSMERQEQERWEAMDGTGTVEEQPARSTQERVYGGYLVIDSVEDLQPVDLEDTWRKIAECRLGERIRRKPGATG